VKALDESERVGQEGLKDVIGLLAVEQGLTATFVTVV
jgi:hypothetical protein